MAPLLQAWAFGSSSARADVDGDDDINYDNDEEDDQYIHGGRGGNKAQRETHRRGGWKTKSSYGDAIYSYDIFIHTYIITYLHML